MTGAIRDLEVESEESSDEEEVDHQSAPAAKKSGGMFSIFKGTDMTNIGIVIILSMRVIRRVRNVNL